MTSLRIILVLGFISVLTDVAQTTDCTQNADIVILLDISGSIMSSFQHNLDLIRSFINNLDIGDNKVHLTVVTFASAAHNYFKLNSYNTTQDLIDAVSRIPLLPGTTHLERGLDYVVNHAFKNNKGDRQDAPNILIVMTDGNPSDRILVETAAKEIHKQNIYTFVVGIGQTVSWCDIVNQNLATDPTLIYGFQSYNYPTNELLKIIPYTCNEQSPWTDWTPCMPNCSKGVQRQTSHWFQQNTTQSRIRTCPRTDHNTGIYGPWSEWGTCSTGCGEGVQNRTRVCYSGVCGEAFTDHRTCSNSYGCKVYSGSFGEWSEWGICSSGCGIGIQHRDRRCYAGTCSGLYSEERACHETIRCQNGVLGEWSTWSECSTHCGNGTQSRNRTCSRHICDGPLEDRRFCTDNSGCTVTKTPVSTTRNTPKVTSDTTTYSTVTTTLPTTSRATTTSTTVIVPTTGTTPSTTTIVPTTQSVVTFGAFGDWSSWGTCSTDCGSGNQIRTRMCYTGICSGIFVDKRSCEDTTGCTNTTTYTTENPYTTTHSTTTQPTTTQPPTTSTMTHSTTTESVTVDQSCSDVSALDCADPQALHFICSDPASAVYCKKSCNHC